MIPRSRGRESALISSASLRDGNVWFWGRNLRRLTLAAAPRSLIILDEIGRGTSTFDGLSLAWSIVEHLHNQVGAKTLFATHYHELTELAARLPRLKNFNVAVREWNDQTVFLRKIVEGGTDKSYGTDVSRLPRLMRMK